MSNAFVLIDRVRQVSHITCEDFDEDIWDAICAARVMYLIGVNKRAWYTVLREYCGYKGNGVWIKRRMATITDEWLAAHPSWVNLYTPKPRGKA